MTIPEGYDGPPGWLRSEKMLENFGVTENTWRDACAKTPGSGISESPAYVARGVAALAQAADADRWAGTIVSAQIGSASCRERV